MSLLGLTGTVREHEGLRDHWVSLDLTGVPRLLWGGSFGALESSFSSTARVLGSGSRSKDGDRTTQGGSSSKKASSKPFGLAVRLAGW